MTNKLINEDILPIPSKPITNIEQMRDKALEMFDKLCRREITIEEAKALADVSNSVMSSVKLQLQYSQMIGEKPYIAFVHEAHKGIPLLVTKKSQQLLDGENEEKNYQHQRKTEE